MEINVHGLNEELAKQAIEFFCAELDIRPSEISVMCDSTIKSNGICYENVYGDYLILVNTGKRNITEIFLTLAHELVHVKQFMKNELARVFAEDAGKTPYKERWWEREAFEREADLVKGFVELLTK